MTSVCSKTMERLLVQQLYSYLEANGLLSDFQFGFRSGKSVGEQLLLCYNYVTQQLDLGYSVDVIFFDYKKAFELPCLGIGDPVLGWLRGLLFERRINIVVHGESSHSVNVTCGVPQSSVIGSLLFLIYI